MLVQSVKLQLVAILLVVGLVGCTTVPQEVDQPDPQVTVDVKAININTKPVDLNSIVANTPKTNPIVKPVTKPIARPPIVIQASVTPKPVTAAQSTTSPKTQVTAQPVVAAKPPVVSPQATPVSTSTVEAPSTQVTTVTSTIPPDLNKGIRPTDYKRFIPPQAFQYFPVVDREVKLYLSSFYKDNIHYFPALIEHESCISLTHSRCWNPKSRLKSAREEGAGLSQITRAYNPDGSIRFDVIEDLKRQHVTALKELSWENIYSRPDLQIRATVLLTKGNYTRTFNSNVDVFNHIAFMDASYNGGVGGFLKEQRACGLAKNCNPHVWFGNVENYCLKSKKPLYGGRSACTINRHHVHDVLHNRMSKYESFF